MKVIFKYNSGYGAILCHRCSTIIIENISEEKARKSKLYYCNRCLKKLDEFKSEEPQHQRKKTTH